VLRDIRELKDDPAAYAAELRRLWGGLLNSVSYQLARRQRGLRSGGGGGPQSRYRRN